MFSPQNPTRTNFSSRGHVVVQDLPHSEGHQRQRQHAEDAHHRRVAVVRREHRANFEVADDGQVDEEAEHARADEIPEAHGHQEIERPLVRQGEFLPQLRTGCESV